MDKKLELYYEKPAGRWEETICLGNGRLGAMVWGGPGEEKLGLNEDSLWSGYERDRTNPEAFESLQEARRLIFQCKTAEAEELIRGRMLGEYGESYLPLGNLNIVYRNLESGEKDGFIAENYRRSLDLGEAVAYVDFDAEGVHYSREMFASYPGQAILVALGASEPVMDLEVSLDSLLKCRMEEAADGLYFKGKCPEHLDPGYIREGEEAVIWGYRGKRFSGKIRVLEGDGEVSVSDGMLRIRGCSRTVLSIEAVRPAALEGMAGEGGYDAIREAHVRDYRAIFDKVELYLGEQIGQPTDVRLENLRAGGEDNGLFALYFQYGRYLMIASSREGSFPANLQGIWSWQWQAPWSSNWTTNINLEMNYWPALSCGLEECMEPYFSFVERLAEHGERTAAVNYRCRGSVQHHNADAWCATTPMGIGYGGEEGVDGSVTWSMWPMGLNWLSQEFYHYYEYTGDLEFLRQKAYPLFRADALFLVDWLVEHEGRYVTCPSTSPENRYYTPEGKSCCVTYGSAMDLELTEDVFRHFLEICEILDIEDPLIPEVEERLSKLEPVKKGSFGQILEWAGEYREVEPGHRHVSHLYGLYPSELWADREDMRQAARISLENRLKNGGGHTGWSCAWIINLFGVLKDGEKAWEYLHTLLTRSTYPNLWDAHEPFQIDGNFGGIAGMANMLVQDRGGEVMLLPALPGQFASGYAKGLRIKGGKVVDIAWEDGKLVSSEIREKN